MPGRSGEATRAAVLAHVGEVQDWTPGSQLSRRIRAAGLNANLRTIDAILKSLADSKRIERAWSRKPHLRVFYRRASA